ncbi:MAG TPA: 2,3-bisphosphoglycerate-independent phosphoglycerate mutase [Candidatus Limiplasma sp.]|mgnify:CR=1 FL=1|nr:2,3-bisphosphoglycerate-independent phosphoglycerate mutase [Candidatus Limiplasma sp.]
MNKPMTALIIMDGFGINPAHEGNAIFQAGTPHLDELMKTYPHTQIGASGLNVGLPDGQMGNSEVGHLNIGAGRIVYQELTRITKDIEDGDFFEKKPLVDVMDRAAAEGKAIHLMGLVSDGGVHSHNTHLYALLEMCKRHHVSKVYVHAFLDGRDVPPTSGLDYVRQLDAKIAEIGVGKIATVMGRYWAMDRDNLWDRVEKAYNAMVLGEGKTADTPEQAVEQSYALGEKGNDEFVLPTVILTAGKPTATIQPEDGVIFFNFRPDRARQITRTFIQPDFNGFARKNGYFHVHFVSMTQYDETFTGLEVVNPPASMDNTLGEYLSGLGKTQLRIAETQKYAHVTFFFNGGVEKPNEGEDRILVPSSKVATFDMSPEMSAFEVAGKAIEEINAQKYDVMILNFANCDMVGHTGIMEAAEEAVKAVDDCVWAVVRAILRNGGRAFVTADHGNADQMVDPLTGAPFTAHTTNPVPLIAIGPEMIGRKLREGGKLCDLAPTMLDSMDLPIPKEMTGKSLLV